MSLSPLFHQMQPQMRPRHAQIHSACRGIRENHKRLSSTSRMFVRQMEAKIGGLAQSCLRLLNAAVHHRGYLNTTNPGCLPEGRAPKDRGLPSQHPGWAIAQGLLQILPATTPKLVWRFFGACIRTVRPGLAPCEHVIAVALRNTLPELLATAAKTSILVKFIRGRLDPSRTEGTSLAG